jgi:hypothetical protein
MPELPENVTRSVGMEVEEWATELVALRRNPTVMKFLELQNRIERVDASPIQADTVSLSDALGPYDLYDAFEFAQDLSGKEVSAQALSRLLFGRFPETSNADWQVMMYFLIERGLAEVVRTTEMGRPDSYRFAAPGNGGNGKSRKGLGLPRSELSGHKAEDLEDIVGLSEIPRL